MSCGSLCVIFCTPLEGGGIMPKSLLPGTSVHSPLKLGLDCAHRGVVHGGAVVSVAASKAEVHGFNSQLGHRFTQPSILSGSVNE